MSFPQRELTTVADALKGIKHGGFYSGRQRAIDCPSAEHLRPQQTVSRGHTKAKLLRVAAEQERCLLEPIQSQRSLRISTLI